MSSKSRQDLENWLKTIDVSGNVLDIGGSQYPIKGRTKSWNIKSYKILDLENPHECKQKSDYICDLNDIYADYNIDNRFTIEDKDKRKKFKNYNEFDIIFCIEVMEYIYRPFEFFEAIKNDFLKKDGILYISFHTLYGLHNPKGEDCLRYTKNAIYKLAENTGFKIEKIITKELTPYGKHLYLNFCKAEGMRLDYKDNQTYDEGYLVIMRKI